jgi:hypothetical protein
MMGCLRRTKIAISLPMCVEAAAPRVPTMTSIDARVRALRSDAGISFPGSDSH